MSANVARVNPQAEIKNPENKNQGTLKMEGKEHSVTPYSDTEPASEAVSELLSEMNEEKTLETPLLDHTFEAFTPEKIGIETEIEGLLETLKSSENDKNEPGRAKKTEKNQSSSINGRGTRTKNEKKVYSSLFDLARTFKSDAPASQRNATKEQVLLREQKEEKPHLRQTMNRSADLSENREYEAKRGDEEEGKGQHEEKQQQQQKQKKEKERKKVQAVSKKSAHEKIAGVENIFIRFMALMARILGQAEAEAHDLYLRIKERTDSIDHLTLFISKINSEKGAIDWSKNDEMKLIIERARAVGVDIPDGKFTWSEEEKRFLKENVQMRKDSMEKMTQLERTDMQRYLQEASQCHQARSNVLKLLKEVNDTIIHNMRGG